MRYSIVIPCYNSSLTIRKVVEMTAEEFKRMEKDDFEFVLVNDCSPDGGKTAEEIKKLAREYPFVTAIDLAKNAGQHNATMAGLNYAAGDYIVTMDDDMQTHPSQLQILLKEIEKGYDVVYGYYPEKKHGFFRNLGSKLNHWSVRILIGKPKELKTSSYCVMRKFVKDSIITYTSPHSYLQGLVLRTTKNIGSVPIKHFSREIGTSNYTFKSLLKLWSCILGFSIVPLRISTYLGYLFAALGIVGAVLVFIQKIIHPNMAIGWPSLMAVVCFFAGLNLLFLGLVGEYIGRMFLGINRQPQFVVREIVKTSEESENE